VTILHFDCFSGAAGDMILGALIDAGAPPDFIRSELARLELPGWSLEIGETTRAGLRATNIRVAVDEPEPGRSFPEIVAIVERARLAPRVKARALRTFELLGAAEARVHGRPVDEIHLHEVGGTDALVDIVGGCAAIEHFGPTAITVSPIATGSGGVQTAHGILPNPVPVAAELLKGASIYRAGAMELITPTGAALLAANCTSFDSFPPMTIAAAGYGAGDWDLENPNVVRVLVGETLERKVTAAVLIEANLDDLNPEILSYTVDRLLSSGAQDAWITPIVMKKGRSAHTLSVLCDEAHRHELVDLIFHETTTLGVRLTRVDKHAHHHEFVEVDVDEHPVRVKIARNEAGLVTVSPEFEDARAAARATGRPLKEVYARAIALAQSVSERG
jgi:pyridinium-3,5-bisthiocarboxylic acid mononucleotide nickel chelatase